MEQFYKQGEFTHDSSNPFLSFVSSVLDITIIKPIIDGCIGKDLITGEDLTDMERGLKVVFAMLEEFNKLRLTDVKDLTKEQIAQMKAIREAVPKIDANTYIQKTIPASDIDKYIGEDGWSTIGGYVARYDDVSHIKGYDNVVAIFDGKHFV